MRSPYLVAVAAGISAFLSAPVALAGDPLAAARLHIRGSRLTIYADAQANDADQLVSVGEQARVRTCYGAVDEPCGAVGAGDPRITGLEVVADLNGPELPQALELRTVPGGAFVLPVFQREGKYRLENIRLTNRANGAILGWCDPPAAELHVAQVVLTSAKVTRLTLADLQERGIHLSQDNYQAFDFAVGFAIAGEEVTITLPVLYAGGGAATPLLSPEVILDGLPDEVAALVSRWQPPKVVPFVFEPSMCDPQREERCMEQEVENVPPSYPLFGAIVIPGTVSFLHQYFDARLVVANGAPEGNDAMLADLTASLKLPAGGSLRLAVTNPSVAVGQRVPLVAEDGASVIGPEEQAAASWTVEGLKAGTHTLQWELTGELRRPGRAPMALASKAQGLVEVVDARFHLAFSHPDVVRESEPYTLFVTISNLSRAPQEAISVTLEHRRHHEEPLILTKHVDRLDTGESETLEFGLVSDVTGKVFATTFQAAGEEGSGSIRLHTGVGELGIPLSPASLVLPRFTERLGTAHGGSDALLRANIRLLGLAYSLATAPAGMAPGGLPQLTTPAVERRAWDLAEAGRRTFLHDGLLESLEVLALDQLGNRHPLTGLDELRRASGAGAEAAAALADLIRQEQVERGLDAVALLEHFAQTTSYAPPYLGAVLVPADASPAPRLAVRQITSDGAFCLSDGDCLPGDRRGLPFGELFRVSEYPGAAATAPLALVGHVELDTEFQILVANATAAPARGRLVLIVPDGTSGTFRRIDFGTVEVSAWSTVAVVAGASVADVGSGGFELFQLADEAPVPGAAPAVQQTVGLPDFMIQGAVQDYQIAAQDIHGSAVAYLFNRPPAGDIGDNASAFAIRSRFAGLDVHGQPVAREATKIGQAAFLQDDGRVLLVRYSGPISPLRAADGLPLVAHEHLIDNNAIEDRFGNRLALPLPPVETETAPLHVGGLVTGRVVRGNGAPAAAATVELLRVRYAGGSSWGRPAVDVVERVAADAEGEFYFDCVEQPHWSESFEDSFTLRATVPAGADPVTEPAAVQEVTSTVRQQGRLATINIALLGRGTVTGRLVWADTGAPVAAGTVIAASTLFSEMTTVTPAADGTFTVAGVPVGPITITGRDADGHSVYATVGISSPGAVVDVVLELQRAAVPGTGTVLGSVVRRRSASGSEEVGVGGADVAVYVAGRPFAQRTTDAAGRFRFDDVPEGQVTVQAASWAVSRTAVLTDLILATGETQVVKVILSESLPRTVVGTVFFLDPVLGTAVPVAGAPVFIPRLGVLSYTAADGSYRLEGVPVQGVADAAFTVTAIDYGRQLEGRTTLAPILDGSPDEIDAEAIVLRPQLGGLDGVVLDPLGRPYDGAEVVLFPIAIKSSGSGGRFSFNDVPIGAVSMTAEPRLIAHVANGMQTGKVGYFGGASTQVVYGGHRPFVTVRMRGSGIVRVMTKTHAGDLIQSLVSIRPTVYVEGEKVVRASPAFLEMAEEMPGVYEMEIPVGEFQVSAYNPFHGVETVNGLVAYAGQVLEYTVTFAAAGTVTGTVLDVDGVTPVPGARVVLQTETFHPQPQVADGLGQFTFDLVPPGNVMVTASAAPGGVERVGAILGSITVPGQVVDLPVRLKARGSISGRVVELTASGLVVVPYAQVQVHEYSYPNRRVPAGGGFVLAGPDGRYQVSGVFEGAVGVVARDPGQVTREGSVSGLITTDWQVVDLPDIVLSTSVGTLHVLVKDGRTGEPVPDCQVTLGSGEATTSDDTGLATFEALPLGVYAVYAFHAPSGRGGRANTLRLETPGESLSTVVSLDQTGEVRGTLFDDPPMTVPVAGAVVELRGTTAVGEMRALATTEGAGGEPGRFAFAGIPEGSFTLTAASSGSPRRAGASVELTALSPIADVALVLEPVGDLYVRVLERLHGGIAEIDTREVALSVAVEQDGYGFTQISPGEPYPDHAFVFPDVLLSRNTVITVQELAGELRTGRLALFDPRALDAHGGDGSEGNPHRLVLGAKGVVRVTVRDAQGTLVPGASVSLTASNGAPMSAAAGADGDELGVAVFLAVPAGTVTASAWLPGTAVGGTAVGVIEDDDQIVDLAVTFTPTVAVSGTVRQPVPDDAYAGDGSSLPPQAGAAVELVDAAAVRQTAITGADGSFRFVGVSPGGCTVKAWQPGGDGRVETSAIAHGPNGSENVLLPLVLDAAPPRVVSITPTPGMDRVSRSAAVEIVFSEPLAPGSLPGSETGGRVFALRSASGQAPAGVWTAVVDTATHRQHVTFTPSEPYDNFTVYGLTVDAGGDGVRDLAGRLLAENGSVGSNFKTADTIGPEVIGTLPEVSRPVPPLDPLRIDFNEALTVSEEALDGDGTDDAGELYWGRDVGGVFEWRPYPAGLHLTRNGFSLSVTPTGGLILTGDTLRRRVVVSRLSDASGNVMAPTELAFRVRDANPPLVTVPYESVAPAGMLTHGMSYTLQPDFALGSVDFITETPPAGDVDRVEYFLVDPSIPDATPAFVSRAYPFAFTFAAAYLGDGTTPRPFPVWVRAVDTSENAGSADHLPLEVVNNLPPGIAAVSVSAVAPVAGVAYAGSTLRVVAAGVGDPDGNQVTLSVELWRDDPPTRLATAPAVLVSRPASGSWSDLTAPSFDLTLPADVAEATSVFVGARAIDSQGALAVIESERLAVADDARPPTVDGVVARRSWPAPAGVTPPVFVIGDRLCLEFSARDAETGIRSVNIAFEPGDIFAAPLVATRVPGSASLFRTNELTVPADAFTEETIITALVRADDHDGNVGEAALAVRVAPSPDHDAPAVEWLTPWEGAAWPAAYTSVVSTEAGAALLLRVRASDTIDDGAGGSLPGSVVSVEFRAPASDGLGGIVAGEWVTGTAVDPDADSSHGVYECVVHVPNDIPTGSAIPLDARVVDTGNLATVATISLTARAARRVWEGVETAVLSTDPITAAGGDPNGPLFLLDGATVAIYPADDGAPRSVSSLFLFAGGEGAGPVTVHASTLTAPKATSYASTAPFYPLALQIDEALGVGAGCAIDVSGLGLLGNTSQQSVALPGETVSGLYAGGSHGGKGWFGSPWDIGGWERTDLTPAGSVYDSLRDPHLPGSGGTSNNPGDAGGRGGGVVRLLADSASVRLAGDIRADGERSWRGGGAGGAVLLRAHMIEGSGRITAAGGDGSSSGRSGGGGGGRIAVLYREEGPGVDLAGQTSAAGGADSHNVSFESRRAGAGTIYLEQFDPETGSASGIGRLLVANTTGKPAAITPLPALGDGTLLDVSILARELIVEAPDAIGESVGDWVVATDGTGAEVAALRIVSQNALEQPPGSPRGFRLGVEADAQILSDLSTALGSSTVTIHGRNRLAALEGRGAARIVVGDDVAIGEADDATPSVNDRSALTLDAEARALLRGEGPVLQLDSTPPAGSDVPVGTSIDVRWTVSDPLGLATLRQEWSRVGPATTSVLVEPTLVDNAAAPHRLAIGGAPAGPIRLALTAADIAGRSVATEATWVVLPNQPPTVAISFAPGTPAALLPGQAVTVVIDASDAEGLQQVALRAIGPVTPSSQVLPLAGSSAHLEITLSVAQAALASETVTIQAEVLDIYAASPVVSSVLEVGILADVEPPDLTMTVAPPSAGDLYTAGNVVTLTATATDNVALNSLTISLDGHTRAAGASPLGYSWTAPPVDAPTEFVFEARAADSAENEASQIRRLTVQPLVNPSAPTVSFACPSEGAMLPSGYDGLLLQVISRDDVGVAAVDFFQGSESTPFASVSPASGTPAEFVASAIAPPLPVSGAPVDTQFRVRARDASNNFTEAALTVHVVEAVTLDPAGANDWSALSSAIAVLGSGVLVLDQPRSLGGLIILRGASISHAPSAPGAEHAVDLTVSGSVYIECGGSIDVSARGYAPGATHPDAVQQGFRSGGSHLGYGGLVRAPLGSTFGSVYTPSEAGAGGNDAYATRGGGVVHLATGGGLLLDGGVFANGGDVNGSGGKGAGGSVWISTTGSVSGRGAIQARGGQGSYDGMGGGGAIALDHRNPPGVEIPTINAAGGKLNFPGGAGTILLRGPESTFGALIVDNDGTAGRVTELPALGSGEAMPGSLGPALVTAGGLSTSNLAGHWRLDEGSGATVGDASANANGGTLLGAPEWVAGREGGALRFDGIDDFVEIPDSPSLRLAGDITVAAWVQVESPAADWVRVVGKGASDARNYGLWYYGPGGHVMFQVSDGSNYVTVGTTWGTVANPLYLQGGGWHLLVGVKQGTSISAYLDGVLIASTGAPFVPITSSAPVRIGYAGFNAAHKGLIDDVWVYGRALTGAEIRDLMAPPHFLVGHWVELTDAQGEPKGSWSIASIVGRTLTLDANSESGEPDVTAGDRWHGVYRFDSVTVKGNAMLDSRDGARLGQVTVEPGSQLLWFDQTPPVIDATRVSLSAHDRLFWVAGETGVVVDPGGLTSATVRNVRTGETVSVTLNGGGGFAPTPVAGMSDDGVELVATSAHQRPATTTAALGTLPANLDAPIIVASLVEVVLDAGGQRRVVGQAGAVSDAEFPVTLVVGNLGSGTSFTAAPATDGSFNIPFEGSAGDQIRLTASDGHPQTRSTTIELGALAGNSAPLVDTAKISVTYEPPVVGGEDPRPAAYVVHFADGALSDPEMPIQLEIPYPDGSDAWTEGAYSEWGFDWRLDGGGLAPGMTLTLIATDSHPGEPLSTTVQLGPLPIDNYGPPAVDVGRTSLLPLGLGFQVAGREGAVVDPDGPVTVTLSSPQGAWTSDPLTVTEDGSFYARIDGDAGDEIFIQATDSHGVLPLATESISLGVLPDSGMTISEVALDGHVATRLRGDFVILDGGAAAAWPWLRWYLDESSDETVAPPLTGLTAATDVVWSERGESPLVLDGTDVVAWVCTDDACPTQSPGRMTVSAGGALTRGLAHAGYLFLASEGAATSLHVLSPPFIDATGAVAPACGGAVATLELPVPAGTHVLEVFPGYAGEIAILTDQAAAAVLIVDVTDPMAPALSRTIDLAGTTTPTWGVWERGELLLGRSDGGIGLWRWGSGTLTPWAEWLPAASAARGAARMGDQLWVGLADGRLQQVDLLDSAQPHLVGEVDLVAGAGVVAVSDLGGSLLVATDSSLLHVWARVMPPEINPGEVAWGRRPGLSWARAEVTSYENVDRTTVLWEGLEGTYDSQTSLYTVAEEIVAPPTVRAVDEHGVPGGPFTPTDWQTWGDWMAVRSEWFPTGAGLPPPTCSASVTTAGAAPGPAGDVPWLAAVPTGSAQADLAYTPAETFVGSSPPLVSALAATGTVTELVSFGETLLVLDDGLGVWDVGDPASPTLLAHSELFAGDPVAAAEAETSSWPPSIVAAAGTPLRIAVIGVGDPRQPEIGGEAVLPDVVEPVIDVARVRESEVVALLGGGGRLLRVNAADPQTPVLIADRALPSGPAPVALAVYCDLTESGCGDDSLVAVVRDGWGVEIYALADLQLLHAVPLDGTPRDALFARDDGSTLHLLVTLGFGHGVASVTGLPAAASAVNLHPPGDTMNFVQHDAGSSGLSSIAIATPTGIVQVTLPCRLEY